MKVHTRATLVHLDWLIWMAILQLRVRPALLAHILMVGLFRVPSVLLGQSTTTPTRRHRVSVVCVVK